MKGRTRGSVVKAACAVAALLVMESSVAQALAKGARRIYRDAGATEWCVTVIALDTGVDGKPWVWFGYVLDPRRVEHVPSAFLGAECAADAAAAGSTPIKSAPPQRAS